MQEPEFDDENAVTEAAAAVATCAAAEALVHVLAVNSLEASFTPPCRFACVGMHVQAVWLFQAHLAEEEPENTEVGLKPAHAHILAP